MLPELHFDNAFVRELPGDPETGPGLREVRGALLSGDPELASRSVQHHLAGAYTRLQLLDLPPG